MSTRQNEEWGQKIQLTNSTYYASDPTQTFAPNGTAIVFWAAGGSIYGCPAVRACSPFLVFSGGSNLFVSVEWPRGGSSGILLMWTEFTTTSSGQRESVLFTTLATEGATPSSSPISFYGILAAVIGIAIIFMIVRYFPRKQLFR